MKPKSARFGMTNAQLGILAGAAAVALLVIGGLSWFVFAPPSSEKPTAVATQVPPTPSPTVQATVTTLPATPSPEIAATSAPPDGWVEFGTQGARLWLPSNFVGGDMIVNRAESINSVTRLGGARFKSTVNAMKQAPSRLVMWMVDKTVSNDPIIMIILVTREVSAEGTGIEEYIQNSTMGASTAQSTTVFETKKTRLLGREARRVVYRQQIQAGYEITGVAYYVKDENDFWIIDYMLDPNKYTDMLTMVEQSIHTFDLVEE